MGICTASLLFVYSAPVAGAFLLPAGPRAHTLDALSVPALGFPVLGMVPPTNHEASQPLSNSPGITKTAKKAGNTNLPKIARPSSQRIRVPVVVSAYGMTKAGAAPATTKTDSSSHSAGAGAGSQSSSSGVPVQSTLPVVTSTVGTTGTSTGKSAGTGGSAPQSAPDQSTPPSESSVGVQPAGFGTAPAKPTPSSTSPGPSATTIVLGAPDPASPSIGDSVTLTATVSPLPDGGTVAFEIGGQTIDGCSAQPVDSTTGAATCSFSTDSAGDLQLGAAYSGDDNFGASTTAATTALTVSDSAATSRLELAIPLPPRRNPPQPVTPRAERMRRPRRRLLRRRSPLPRLPRRRAWERAPH